MHQQQTSSLIDQCPSASLVPANQLYATNSEQGILLIQHPKLYASLALQGGQLLTCNIGHKPLLWLSPKAVFDGSSAIRGGIPVCLPWFGVNQQQPSLPKHGFARNSEWQLLALTEDQDSVTITVGFESLGHADFAAPFSATLEYIISDHLNVKFSLINQHHQSTDFSYALHSYLAVDDSHRSTVTGLSEHQYLDNLNNLQATRESGAIQFNQEVDRVYPNCPDSQFLHCATPIEISSSTMPTAIIWTPHQQALSMADTGLNYRQFVCVERGCAFDNTLTLAAGASHQASMILRHI